LRRETLPVDRSAGIEQRPGKHGEFAGDMPAEPLQDVDADDKADTGEANGRAEQFPAVQGLVPGQRQGHDEDVDRRGRVQDAGQAAIDVLLAPGQQRPGTDAVEHRLQEQHPPGTAIARQALMAPGHHGGEEPGGNGYPQGDQAQRW